MEILSTFASEIVHYVKQLADEEIKNLDLEGFIELAYSYFDLKQWDKALYYLKKVREENLYRGLWERTKRWELIACVLIELGKEEEGIQSLKDKVITEYENDIDGELSYPREILQVCKKYGFLEIEREIKNLI